MLFTYKCLSLDATAYAEISFQSAIGSELVELILIVEAMYMHMNENMFYNIL